MRKGIVLLALLSLLTPLAAQAAAPPGTSVKAPTLAPDLAVHQIVAPLLQEQRTTPPALDTLFPSVGLGKVCSISCRPCFGSCPAGEGVCISGGC